MEKYHSVPNLPYALSLNSFSMEDACTQNRYLTPAQLADALGVGRSTVHRWVDQGRILAERTPGGHRRIGLPDAVHFVRSTNARLANPAALGIRGEADATLEATQPESLAATLEALLRGGDGAGLRSFIWHSYVSGASVHHLVDQGIVPAMQRIGQLWPEDPRGILVEHRATELCVEAINHLNSLAFRPADSAPLAIGGAIPGDPFILPSLMASTTLRDAGWRTQNYGSNTPPSTMGLALRETGARLVWLSVSTLTHMRVFTEAVDELSQIVVDGGAQLLVGGRGVPAGWQPVLPCVHRLNNMQELDGFARGLAAAHTPLPAANA